MLIQSLLVWTLVQGVASMGECESQTRADKRGMGCDDSFMRALGLDPGRNVRRHPPRPLLGAAISNDISIGPLGKVNGVGEAKAVAAGECLLHVSTTRCYWSVTGQLG